jgi:hypothetical protein
VPERMDEMVYFRGEVEDEGVWTSERLKEERSLTVETKGQEGGRKRVDHQTEGVGSSAKEMEGEQSVPDLTILEKGC